MDALMKKSVFWMILLTVCFLSIGTFAQTFKGKKDYYGKRHGVWTQYYGKTDRIDKISTYFHGVLNGPRKYFYESGKKFAEEVYKDGQKQGPFTDWYDNKENSEKTKGTYIDGHYSGEKTDWYENHEIKSVVTYVRGSLEGKAEYFYSSGGKNFKTVYKYGKHHGAYVEYYDNVDNSRKQEGKHSHGTQHGEWIELHSNKEPKFKGNYKFGKLNGSAEYFYFSGRKKFTTNYLGGNHHGPYVEYYDNVDNSKKREGKHAFSFQIGEWTEWHQNNVPRLTGSFNDKGKKIGKWKEFDNTKKLLKTETYKNGTLVKGDTKKK